MAIWGFTEITSIVAPAEADAGSTVHLSVAIKNCFSTYIKIQVRGHLEYGTGNGYPSLQWLNDEANVPPGGSFTYYSNFIMPSRDINPGGVVTIHAQSYVWCTADEQYVWILDDEKMAVVSLPEEAEMYAGRYTRFDLEYNGTTAKVPVSSIPPGKQARLRVTGRNDMSTPQRLGIYWIIYAPSGGKPEVYFDWGPYIEPGQEYEFIGGFFNLDEVGTYTIKSGLIMNPTDPIYVHTYYGDLCTVVAGEVPSFSEFAITNFSKV